MEYYARRISTQKNCCFIRARFADKREETALRVCFFSSLSYRFGKRADKISRDVTRFRDRVKHVKLRSRTYNKVFRIDSARRGKIIREKCLSSPTNKRLYRAVSVSDERRENKHEFA